MEAEAKGVLMGKPKQRSRTQRISIPEGIFEELKSLSERTGVPIKAHVLGALHQYLKQFSKPEAVERALEKILFGVLGKRGQKKTVTVVKPELPPKAIRVDEKLPPNKPRA
jgi:hypothetical protein